MCSWNPHGQTTPEVTQVKSADLGVFHVSSWSSRQASCLESPTKAALCQNVSSRPLPDSGLSCTPAHDSCPNQPVGWGPQPGQNQKWSWEHWLEAIWTCNPCDCIRQACDRDWGKGSVSLWLLRCRQVRRPEARNWGNRYWKAWEHFRPFPDRVAERQLSHWPGFLFLKLRMIW
jgi:hypothetical protein